MLFLLLICLAIALLTNIFCVFGNNQKKYVRCIMKIRFLSVLDALFSALIAFVLFFLIINFFVEKVYAISLSFFLSIPVFTLALKKLWDKNLLTTLKKRQEIEKENCIFALSLMTEQEIISLFQSALIKEGVLFEKKNGALIIKAHKCALFFNFSFDGIRKTDVVKAFNHIPKDFKAYILAQSFTSDILSFIDKFGKKIIAVDGTKVYQFLKNNDCLPKSKVDLFDKKPKAVLSFKTFIQRKNAKRYLSFGAVFLFMSSFVSLKLYYVCCGCIFLFLALVSRLYGKTKQTD